MTYPEMVEAGEAQKKSSRLYKAEAAQFVDKQLSSLIAMTSEELVAAASAEPVSLRDTDDVKRRTVVYLRACEQTSTFPSMSGLARSMGLSRQALYDCLWRREPKETAIWLELCRDSFSDLLAAASLRNNCNSIVAIFLQKALYGLRETTEIIARKEEPYAQISQAELESRILNSIPAEMEDN